MAASIISKDVLRIFGIFSVFRVCFRCRTVSKVLCEVNLTTNWVLRGEIASTESGPCVISQEDFVDEIYAIMRNEAVPLSFDKHIYFINFTTFDKQSPTYINLIREPTDKAVSRSIYNRHKDDLIQCIVQGKKNCSNKYVNVADLTVPYFCGHHPKCLLNNAWAIQMAKTNVERFYPVIGVLDELNATLSVLERKIPFFFKGVQDVFTTNLEKFKRKQRLEFPPKILHDLKHVLATEYEFYNWIKRRLFRQLQL